MKLTQHSYHCNAPNQRVIDHYTFYTLTTQQIILLHLTLSLTSSSDTPTLCVFSVNTFMNLLCGSPVFFLPDSSLFSTFYLIYIHYLSSQMSKPSQPCLFICVSKSLNLICPCDVLIPNPVHSGHSQ